MPPADSDSDTTLDWSWPARVRKGIRAHPVAIITTVVALALGVALSTAGWAATTSSDSLSAPPPPPRRHSTLLSLGPVSLEAADAAGQFISAAGDRMTLAAVGANSRPSDRQAATLTAVPGLATVPTSTPSASSAGAPGSSAPATSPAGAPGSSAPATSPAGAPGSSAPATSSAGAPGGSAPAMLPGGGRDCFSFRAADGRFLHDAAGRLRLAFADHSPAFAREATFCLRDGFAPGSALLEESGQRGRFVRHVGAELRVSEGDPRGSSFLLRKPLARG